MFAELLAALSAEPGGLSPVGWYHSHTRTEIFLSDADLEIHKQYFPEPWQVALVLKPHTFQPTRAGFFVREKDGAIYAKSSRREFVVEPWAGQPGPAAEAEGAGADAASAVARVKLQPELDFGEPETEAPREVAERAEVHSDYVPQFAQVSEVRAEPSRGGWLPIILALNILGFAASTPTGNYGCSGTATPPLFAAPPAAP